MNTRSRFLAVSALALLGCAAAQAETYQGVHPLTRGGSRAAVQAEAMAQAQAADPNVVRGSRGAEPVALYRDRAQVRAEAARAAAAPDQNVNAGSRVNSQVISTMAHPAHARTAAAVRNGSRL